ncbi:hypothetical protein NBRC3257_0825 [Gluconobacter thailandicus NBRC 3257]|uniref:Uncharacterized protein n=1 Tax=Gluconobacter thailandicus NBRC 3257 TaxID=1381097 RepID=A0ABQ0IUC7_GLUTH|nr:hypothetical protein NBRC3255_1888 [Gluconobacter thailandicus NBRC 3255]GAD25826.1 hypothetical protein NBRC3257_0825 [Gluconobacter thailandicus NBRC 3257]
MLLDNVPSDSDSLHQRNGHYNPLVLASGIMRHDGAPGALHI